MITPDAQGSRPAAARKRSIGRTIGGVALMLLGVALMAYGAHYLTENGTCSSTGYVSYGPVPKCHGNEFLYITSAFFLGPAVVLVGWGMAGISGLLWPTFCVGLAVGFITIRDDVGPPAGEKAFGLLAGYFFIALAVLSVVVTLRNRHRKRTAHTGIPGIPGASGITGITGPGVSPAGFATAPVMSAPPSGGTHSGGAHLIQAVTRSGSDPIDKIARLAQLRDSGALTDEEFEREKAKLLDEM
jgi:putative oligomerization/nucleic acid binding protein